jgi:hypothetical protein
VEWPGFTQAQGMVMGFFRRLFGIYDPNDPLDRLQRSLNQSATLLGAPMDYELWDLAKSRKDHISPAAVSEEYNRLILQKYS